MNLKRNGYFDNCKGLIVGGISDIRENETPFGKTVEEVVLDAVKDFNFPVSFDFPAGHIRDNRTLILGRTINLNVKNNKTVIKFLNDGSVQRVDN
jgi:muramoyltetrapeptide carboxypeptidase